MSDVTAIAAAIAKPLTAAGIRNLTYLGDAVSPPVALIAIRDVEYHVLAMQGGMGGTPKAPYSFDVYVVVCRTDDRAGLAQLEGYMSSSGAKSIRALLEADPTLGGAVDTLSVQKAGPPAPLPIGASGVEYVTCPFTVEVIA